MPYIKVMYTLPAVEIFFVTAAIIFIALTAVWILSLIKKNAGIADIFWGIGFIIIAWTSFSFSHGFLFRCLLAASLTTLWGARLALHIYTRNRGKAEDYRYRNMREKHGERFRLISFFTVFLLQGIMMYIISLPVQAIQVFPSAARITGTDIAGTIIWCVGFYFEAAGDLQLKRFLRKPENRGRVLKTGLWKYTRHPNYFGEATMWWGIFIIALSVKYGIFTIAGPFLITFLLIRVSGISLLEKEMIESNPEYAEYTRTTSPFLPLPPDFMSKISALFKK